MCCVCGCNVCTCIVWVFLCVWSDTVAERLRRLTRNQLGLSRVGSSPASVDLFYHKHFYHKHSLFSTIPHPIHIPTSYSLSLPLFLHSLTHSLTHLHNKSIYSHIHLITYSSIHLFFYSSIHLVVIHIHNHLHKSQQYTPVPQLTKSLN